MKQAVIFGKSDDFLTQYIQKSTNLRLVDKPALHDIVISLNEQKAGRFCMLVMRRNLPPHYMEHFDLLTSPYYDVVMWCESKGFYCSYIPFDFEKKEPKIKGEMLGAPLLTEEMLYGATEKLLSIEANFIIDDWAVALKKEVEVWSGDGDEYFRKVRKCLVDRFDSYYAKLSMAHGVPIDKEVPYIAYDVQAWGELNLEDQITLREDFEGVNRK